MQIVFWVVLAGLAIVTLALEVGYYLAKYFLKEKEEWKN